MGDLQKEELEHQVGQEQQQQDAGTIPTGIQGLEMEQTSFKFKPSTSTTPGWQKEGQHIQLRHCTCCYHG